MSHLWEEKNWPEIKKYLEKNDVAILPVASIEQHSLHSPLSTDSIIAEGVAKEVGKLTDVLVLPILKVGISSHHRQFPGSLWVSPITLFNYLKEMIINVASHGINKIAIINGHGGNVATLQTLALELRQFHDIFVSIFQPWDLPKEKTYELKYEERWHAATEETSQVLFFRPDLINMDKAKDVKLNDNLGGLSFSKIGGWRPDIRGVFVPLDALDLTETGQYNIVSTTASKEIGEKLIKPAIEVFVEHIKWLKKAKIEDLLPKPHK